MSPDKLRDHIYELVVCASDDERRAFISRLNRIAPIGPLLRTLGFASETVADLSHYEVAQVVRYLKYNKPDVMPSVLEALDILAPIKEKLNGNKAKLGRLSGGSVSSNRIGELG
jgi:hypothetical protein